MDSMGERVRPFGEPFVHIERPPQMFGDSLTFGIQGDNGEYWVAKVVEGGHLVYEPLPSGTIHVPTLYIDEREKRALVQAIDNLPRYEGDAADGLKDARAQRDKLFNILGIMVGNHHELARMLGTPPPIHNVIEGPRP